MTNAPLKLQDLRRKIYVKAKAESSWRLRKRGGFGWKRWSSEWIHAELGLFSDYGIRYRTPLTKALPNR